MMDHGVIYHKNIKRGMFVVMLSENNFAVFESYNINEFHLGDVLYGNFSECGSATITNTNTLKNSLVIIQNVGLDAAMAMAKADIDE